MSFGFDPSIILGATKVNEPTLNDTLRTLADLRQSRTADQHNQAQLADMLRKQGQEQTLADIYKANAGTGTGLAPDLMRAGLGPQAMAWQDQEAQMAAKKAQGAKAKQELESAYRKHIGERVQDVKDQASLDTVREEFASSGDPFLSAYVSKIPEKYDPVTIAPIKNQAISAEKRSDIEQKGLDREGQIEKDRLDRANRTTNARILAGQKEEQRNAEGEERDRKRYLEGFKLRAEAQPSDQEMEKIRKAQASSRTIDETISEMEKLYRTYGNATLPGPARAQMEALATDLMMSAKGPEMYQLGVIAGPDEKLLNRVISNPTSAEATILDFVGDNQSMSRLGAFRGQVRRRFANSARSLGFSPEGNAKQGPPATPAKAKKGGGGKVSLHDDPAAWGDADEARLAELERKAGGAK